MATPPLWEIRRDGGCIHIFAVRPGARDLAWFTDDVRAALRSSATFWRETPDTDEAASHPLLVELGLAGEHSLTERVGPQRHARIAATATSLDIDVAALEVFRPWLVAQLLNQGFLAKAGVDPALNPDEVLTAEANSNGCGFRTEFSVEEALRTFGEQPEAVELQHLDYILWMIDKGSEHLDRTYAGWLEGDLSLDEADIAELGETYPAFTDVLLKRRNVAWMPRFEAMLTSGGTTFVAVGTYHMIGRDSIPACAEDRGLPIKRVL